MPRISKEGQIVFKNMNNNKFKVYENLSHDGYDVDGPESDIWDLFVFDQSKEKIYHYHRERWFNYNEIYTLYEEWTFTEIKKNGYYNMIRHLNFI